MSKVAVSESNLTDIADSIRTKLKTQDTYTPAQMSEAIDSIETGGGDVSEYFFETIKGGQEASSGLSNMIKKIPSNIIVEGTSLNCAFIGAYHLENIPMLDTSNVTTMQYMFASCGISTIPLIDTSKVTGTGMVGMFQGSKIKTIPLINTSGINSIASMFDGCPNLESVPNLDTSKVTSFGASFRYCVKLVTAPNINTSRGTTFINMFSGCTLLENVPAYSFASATSSNALSNIYQNCLNLTDQSINNILASCITASSYTGTKTLSKLGFSSNAYPKSRIQALSNYQDFINAGWSIGY